MTEIVVVPESIIEVVEVASSATTVLLSNDRGPQGAAGVSGTQPIFSVSGSVSVVTGRHRFYIERAGTVTKVRGSVGTAPIGSALTFNVRKNGTSTVGSVSIAAGTVTALLTNLSAPLLPGDYLTVDVTGVGSTTPGADLTVSVTIE